jgi:hypothetical protein
MSDALIEIKIKDLERDIQQLENSKEGASFEEVNEINEKIEKDLDNLKALKSYRAQLPTLSSDADLWHAIGKLADVVQTVAAKRRTTI